MQKKRFSKWKDISLTQKNALLFMMEGAAFTLVSAFSINITNLFLTRLNASDYEISIYTMLTQIVGMTLLIPLALFADRLKNKKKLVCTILFIIALCFFTAAAAPLFGNNVVGMLVVIAALGSGSIIIFNSIWQSYFVDVVQKEHLNLAYAQRNRVTFVIHLIVSLFVGIVLSSITSDFGKIRMHQVLYVAAAVFAVIEIFILSQVKGGDIETTSEKTFPVFLQAIKDLFKNKKFLVFLAVMSFFHLTWKLDGTLFYLSQVKYIGLTEFWLSVSMAANSMGQILSVGFWAKLNEKKGSRFGLIFGAIGMTLSPICIILPLGFDGFSRIIFHLVLRFITDLGFTTIQLNIIQNLLQIISEKNRTLSIAVYTTFISLLSSFMPIVGVAIYTAFGATQQAMVDVFWIIGAVRVFSLLALVMRWYTMRKEAK